MTAWLLFGLKVYEKELRAQAKAAGGRWNPDKQLWFVQYGKIAGTQLEKHIQVDEKDNVVNLKRVYFIGIYL